MVVVPIIIILIIIFGYHIFSQNKNKNINIITWATPSIENFKHTDIIQPEYNHILSEYSVPDKIINEPDGIVIWYNRDNYKSIIIRDEVLINNSQNEFLYTSIHIQIPHELLIILLKLNKSIYYDQLKQELTLRGHSLEYNSRILYYLIKIIKNPKKLNYYINKNNLTKNQNYTQKIRKLVF